MNGSTVRFRGRGVALALALALAAFLGSFGAALGLAAIGATTVTLTVALTADPAAPARAIELPAPRAVWPAAPPAAPRVATAVANALAQVGQPYVWGAAGPDAFDCSGLVFWAYGRAGLTLPRTAQMQYDATARVGRDELQPGDLVFFEQTYFSPHERITHVGVYIGDGLMVNAPAPGKEVRVESVFDSFWSQYYAGGGRVVGA